jgi:hypothetical protein
MLAFTLPSVCKSEEYPLAIDFSPNIINISSNRVGDIRVLTHFSYSTYIADGNSVFIYFNDGDTSIQNIQVSRDSLGHLILRFSLEDLLAIESDLIIDGYNSAVTVLVMNNGDEYIGSDEDVFIVDKMAP